MIPTYQDAVNHLLDYLGSDPGEAALRDAKKAVLEAYRDLANCHTWTYLYTPAIIQTSPMSGGDPDTGVSDGSTITYLHSTGQFPRQVTLDGATWPSWAADGMLTLGHLDDTSHGIAYGANLAYEVDRLVSPQILTLNELTNPGADLTTPQSYAFYRAKYPLPADFVMQDVTFIPNNFPNLQFIHPREWMRVAQNEVRTGKPNYYSITGYTERNPGKLCVRFAPLPDLNFEVHYAYKRRPRPLVIFSESPGFMSVDAGLTDIIASNGAIFWSGQIGSVIRFSADNKNLPTDDVRENPPFHEAVITDVFDDTHALIDTPCPAQLQAVKYTISDILDIDPGSMTSVLLRLCEQKLSTIRIMKDRTFPREEYTRALDAAKCADSRTMMGRSPREYLFNRQTDHSLWRNR